MAFATVYRTKLFSADGNAYQAWLQQDGFGGSVTNVVGTEAPATIVWGKKGVDPWTPILASHAEVQNWRLPTALSGYGTGALTSLIGGAPQDWRLRIVKGASQSAIDAGSEGSGYDTYWVGQVLFDGYEDVTTADPHEITVQAVDGLGTLKEQPFYQIVGSLRVAYSADDTLLDIAVKCFDRIGFGLPIRSALAWYPNGESTDPLASLTVSQLAFYEGNKAYSCYQVLAEIARCLGARWCQYDGAWWLVARELLSGSNYTAYRYDSTGAAQSPTTESIGASVDADASGVTRITGRRSYRPAWGAVSVVHNHGLVPPLVSEGEFDTEEFSISVLGGRFFIEGTNVSPSVGDSTVVYTNNAQAQEADPTVGVYEAGNQRTTTTRRNFVHSVDPTFHGNTRDPATIKNLVVGEVLGLGGYITITGTDEVAVGQTLAFTGRVRNTVNPDEGSGAGLFNTYWEVRIGDTSTGYYLKRDGTWAAANGTTIDDRAQYMVAPGAEYRDAGFNLGTWIPYVFVSAETAPVAGALTMVLYGSSDRGAPQTNEQEIGVTQWDDVAVVVAGDDGEVLESTRYEVFSVDGTGYPLPLAARDDVTVRLGQGPAQTLDTTLFWSSTLAENWDSANMTAASRTDLTLAALHAETILRAQGAPLENRQETYRDLAATPIAPIAADDPGGTDTKYAPTYLKRNLYHDEIEGEWTAVKFSTSLSVTSESGYTDAGGFQPTTSSSGTAGQGAQSVSIEQVQGAQYIRTGIVTVTDGGGSGGSATVTPSLAGVLRTAYIQVTPLWNTNLEDFGVENVTTTSFDITARLTGGDSQDFIWWVIDTDATLFGEYDFTETRNSHHIISI